MRIEFSAPTGRAVTAQCNALGSSWNSVQAPTGRNNATAYYALSGLGGQVCRYRSALRWALIFRPVGAGECGALVAKAPTGLGITAQCNALWSLGKN